MRLLMCLMGLLYFTLDDHSVYAQEKQNEKITVKGFIVDGETYADLRGVHIYSSSGYGAISNDKGFFQIRIYLQDTLYFSRIDYEKKSLVVTDTTHFNDIVISLKQKTYMLDSVEVRSGYMANSFLMQKEDKPVYIEGITKKIDPKKDYHMGVGGAISSPATALYRAFSKKYKEKKKVYKLEKEEDKRDELKNRAYARLDEYMEIYDAELSYDDYDKLVDKCNMGLQRILNSNDYDLFLWIDDCVNEYLKQRDKGY